MDVLKQLEQVALPPRESLSDQVSLMLKRLIIGENMQPGDRLPAERQMADTLNISRTVLREALNRLIGEHILERPSPRMLQVADFDRAPLAATIDAMDTGDVQFRDLMELRYILEVGSIPLIYEKATPADIAEIEELASRHRREVAEGRSGNSADIQFHTRLLRVVDNSIVRSALPIIEQQIRAYLLREPSMLRLQNRQKQTTIRVVDEHQEIINSLRHGDVAAGLAAMTRHLAPYFARLQARANGENAGEPTPP
ncbi:MAG TPA: FCD domain-containing protein [Thermomicrobiales bacterium]|nr:FCD domain-containing protein [Thermomicrobiales bacterium]